MIKNTSDYFIVENTKMRLVLQECLTWFYKLPMKEQWSLYAEISPIIEDVRKVLGENDYPLGE
jgi:hypothetical protein